MACAWNGYHPPVYFVANGLIAGYLLATPIDGQRRMAEGPTVRLLTLAQRVDGTGGTTTVQFYRRTSPTTRISLGTVSLAGGAGANRQATATPTASVTDRKCSQGDQIEMEINAIQAGVAAADITGSAEFG